MDLKVPWRCLSCGSLNDRRFTICVECLKCETDIPLSAHELGKNSEAGPSNKEGNDAESVAESESKCEAGPSNKEGNYADPSSSAKLCPNHNLTKKGKNLRSREKYRERRKKKEEEKKKMKEEHKKMKEEEKKMKEEEKKMKEEEKKTKEEEKKTKEEEDNDEVNSLAEAFDEKCQSDDDGPSKKKLKPMLKGDHI